uniref:Uncharacterized protein n=1 Tax=viral metagenome TaxID=1070528 RepID=A0A6C0DQX1_9ZZZZ
MATKINPGQLVIYIAVVLALFTAVFAGLFGRLDAIVLGLGITLVSNSAGVDLGRSLLMASVATFLAAYLPLGVSSYAQIEGFTDEKEEMDEEVEENFEDEAESDDEEEGFANPEKKKKKRAPLPDHGSRAEVFELGKKYKMPKETDDPEFHLDAGTTFVNAYKQLQPDQISAMTKDTQELINTQKQLMSTLNTLKPLMTDGKQIMDTFQSYFGAGGMPNMGDMAGIADKFAPSAK